MLKAQRSILIGNLWDNGNHSLIAHRIRRFFYHIGIDHVQAIHDLDLYPISVILP